MESNLVARVQTDNLEGQRKGLRRSGTSGVVFGLTSHGSLNCVEISSDPLFTLVNIFEVRSLGLVAKTKGVNEQNRLFRETLGGRHWVICDFLFKTTPYQLTENFNVYFGSLN